MALIFELDLDMVKMNQQPNVGIKYHLIEKLLSRRTQPTGCYTWTIKVASKMNQVSAVETNPRDTLHHGKRAAN